MDEEERRARELLGALWVDPDTPPTVDIGRAVRDGRRRVRIRAATATVAGALTVLVVIAGVTATAGLRPFTDDRSASDPVVGTTSSADPARPQPPSTCSAAILPAPAGHQEVVVTGGDPSGRYLVGQSMDRAGRYHPLLWADDEVTLLDKTGSAESIEVVVNASGIVAWSATVETRSPGYTTQLWRWRDGTTERITAGDGYQVMLVDAAGTVYAVDQNVGVDPSSGMKIPRLLTVPADGQATTRDLTAPEPGGQVMVTDVSPDGTVTGQFIAKQRTPTSGYSIIAWAANGEARLLSIPDGWQSAGTTASADGWIGGTAYASNLLLPSDKETKHVAVRWDARTGAVQLVEALATASGINRYGWMIGLDHDGQAAVLFDDRKLILPTPLASAAGTPSPARVTKLSTTVRSISDDGTTLGGHMVVNKHGVPVRWSCR